MTDAGAGRGGCQIGMRLRPVSGNVDAPANPDLRVALHIVQKILQRPHATGAPQQAAVHADAEHLGCIQSGRVALGVQHIKTVFQVAEEIIALGKALAGCKTHVVGVECVGHDQLRSYRAIALLYPHPERQVVTVVIAVVFKAAEIGHQTMRLRAVASGVPAQRPLAGELGQDLHTDSHVFALACFVQVLVADPAPAVAGNLVPEFLEGSAQLRVPLQRHADAKHRERQLAALKLAQDAPDAGARAVLVEALHAEVARRKRRRAGHFGEKLLGRSITMQHRVLGAFFVVQHKLQRDAGLRGPRCMRRVGPVADQVARVGQRAVVVFHGFRREGMAA